MKRHAINPLSVAGLYAVTPDIADTPVLLNQVRHVLRGGAHVLQYRNKIADAALRKSQAMLLRQLTREFDAVFIVNDDVHLAAEVDADGVHLGGGDASVTSARAQLGATKLIGVSCYNRVSLALDAVRQGADYVAFGAFFPSSVKPDAVNADVQLLQSARPQLDVPIVAIGGITLQNGEVLVDAGADALAVITALWNAPDVEKTALEFSTLFSRKYP